MMRSIRFPSNLERSPGCRKVRTTATAQRHAPQRRPNHAHRAATPSPGAGRAGVRRARLPRHDALELVAEAASDPGNDPGRSISRTNRSYFATFWQKCVRRRSIAGGPRQRHCPIRWLSSMPWRICISVPHAPTPRRSASCTAPWPSAMGKRSRSRCRTFFLECETFLAGIIAEGQQAGVFRRSPDPRVLAWDVLHTRPRPHGYAAAGLAMHRRNRPHAGSGCRLPAARPAQDRRVRKSARLRRSAGAADHPLPALLRLPACRQLRS